ncbi:hypothetical protein [Paractinoplanes hotanensis]|uniref:Uncharacterized protein n=1 Tax=Paractinoplanes hotanensis TaxID=2906497 RepID=A0ABT0YCS9_9ACTN|nr:hypothetical protein [Actinoplanes hotanensis]MCM4083555.1 hypothetical protein [Actinoplanes hotanensis]
MAMLADTVYNAATGGKPDPENSERQPDPDELLAFTEVKAVEQHLLDSYVEVRFRDEHRWYPEEIDRWLGFLASALSARPNSADLTWWDLRPAPTAKRGGHRLWAYLAALAGIAIWTFLSAAIFNGWIYQQLELGLVAGGRVAAAAAICFVSIAALTRNPRAGLLAALGAYIAGTVSASYDLAVGAAIAGGFAWRPLAVRRPQWWHFPAFACVVATAGAFIQATTPSTGSLTGTPWTQGFGAGFVDGWASRGDEIVNGWLLSALVAGLLLWSVVRLTPREDGAAPTRPGHVRPIACAVIAGLLVGILDSLTDDARPDVTDGWRIGPADGWAVGIAVWCAMTWLAAWRAHPAGQGIPLYERKRKVWRAWFTAAVVGVVTLGLNGMGYSARADMSNPWTRAVAEALGVAVAIWFVQHPDRLAPLHRNAGGRFGIWTCALLLAVVTGGLDAWSAGWTRGPITGLSTGLIVAYALHTLRRRPGATRGSLFVSPLDAGMFAIVVVGIAAGFAYGLMFGVTFGLAVQVSRDVSRRQFPSHSRGLTWLGTLGGAILGVVVAVAAGFSGIPAGWLIPIALTSGVAAAIAFGAEGHALPGDLVMSPQRLLHQDRRTFLAALMIIAVAVGLAAGIRTAAQDTAAYVGVVAALSTTFTYGATAGLLIAVAQSRYGAYSLWRLIYAMQGKLPWRMMTFLNEAYDRGILRQNGPSFQFRHQFLQERLAERYARSGPDRVAAPRDACPQ